MDATSPISFTQLLLVGTLLTLLLTWMVTFLVLALRPDATQHTNNEDIPSVVPTISTLPTAQPVSLVATAIKRPVMTMAPIHASQPEQQRI